MQLEQKVGRHPVDRHAQLGAQQQFGRLSGRPIGTSSVSIGVRSTDWSTEGRVGRLDRSTDRRICFSYWESDFVSDQESNLIEAS